MSDFTPGQYQAAAETVEAPPIGTPAIDPQQVTDAAPTEVDIAALLRRMQAQQDALSAEVARMRAAQGATSGEPRLIADSRAARGLIAEHFDRGYRGDGPAVLRLADDMVDAAGNAVQSGDTGPARDVMGKLARALHGVHPGAGDHHYFTQALSIVEHSLPAAADEITGPQPGSAKAVSGGAPVKVLAGSVTG